MNIKLDLQKHCIETEIKKLHNHLISQYFKSIDNRKQLESKIELLQNALENFDFGRLRSTYIELAGNYDNDVILSYDENKHPEIKINGVKISM